MAGNRCWRRVEVNKTTLLRGDVGTWQRAVTSGAAPAPATFEDAEPDHSLACSLFFPCLKTTFDCIHRVTHLSV